MRVSLDDERVQAQNKVVSGGLFLGQRLSTAGKGKFRHVHRGTSTPPPTSSGPYRRQTAIGGSPPLTCSGPDDIRRPSATGVAKPAGFVWQISCLGWSGEGQLRRPCGDPPPGPAPCMPQVLAWGSLRPPAQKRATRAVIGRAASACNQQLHQCTVCHIGRESPLSPCVGCWIRAPVVWAD